MSDGETKPVGEDAEVALALVTAFAGDAVDAFQMAINMAYEYLSPRIPGDGLLEVAELVAELAGIAAWGIRDAAEQRGVTVETVMREVAAVRLGSG